MASMVGNPTGSVGEPGGIRMAAMAKAASPIGVSGGISKGGRGPTPNEREAKQDRRELWEVTGKKQREAREAQYGKAHRPGYRGNQPQNPQILA